MFPEAPEQGATVWGLHCWKDVVSCPPVLRLAAVLLFRLLSCTPRGLRTGTTSQIPRPAGLAGTTSSAVTVFMTLCENTSLRDNRVGRWCGNCEGVSAEEALRWKEGRLVYGTGPAEEPRDASKRGGGPMTTQAKPSCVQRGQGKAGARRPRQRALCAEARRPSQESCSTDAATQQEPTLTAWAVSPGSRDQREGRTEPRPDGGRNGATLREGQRGGVAACGPTPAGPRTRAWSSAWTNRQGCCSRGALFPEEDTCAEASLSVAQGPQDTPALVHRSFQRLQHGLSWVRSRNDVGSQLPSL